VPFRGAAVTLQPFPDETPRAGFFRGLDAVLLSAGGPISRRAVPAIVRDGSLAIDNSSAYREDPAVPLVIPEINGQRLVSRSGIVANPNCTTAVLLMALAPLHRAARAKRVIAASYQAVSGKGARAMEECLQQTRDVLTGKKVKPEVFPKEIAFNVIPQVDDFTADGRTKEEVKVESETRKILEDPSIRVEATCVRVPVMRCHSVAAAVEFERPLTPEEARELWKSTPGVRVSDDPARLDYPTPLDANGLDDVFAGRCRRSRVFENGLAFWCVGDQLRKGAALNAVQILEAALAGSLSSPTSERARHA
jgi:aspartate-semialdehyde dehydrogenase